MIRFECGLDEQTVKELSKYQMKRTAGVYALISIFFAAIGLLRFFKSDVFGGIVMVAVGLLFTPFCILLTLLLQRSNNKAQAVISEETRSTYIFNEDTIEVEIVKGDEFHEQLRMKYSHLHKVEEGATAYYLFAAKSQCLIVSKSGLTEGTLEELNVLLSDRLGKKFKSRQR